jgi:hypothetical protein
MAKQRRWGKYRKATAPPSLVLQEIKAAQQEVQAASKEINEARRLLEQHLGWVPPIMTAVWEE